MKWIYVVGLIVFSPFIIRIVLFFIKNSLQIIAWCLAVAFVIGGIALLINGQILCGIIGLVFGGALSIFLPKVDWDDIDYLLW